MKLRVLIGTVVWNVKFST